MPDAPVRDLSGDPRWSAAVAVAGELGEAGPDLFRVGTSVLVRAGDLLLRAWRADQAAVAEREVLVARALEAAGVPAARLAGPAAQPMVIGDAVVTVWQWVERSSLAVGPAGLGHLAGVLREATVGERLPPDLPDFDPLGAVAALVAADPSPSDPEVVAVVERAAALADPWARVAAPGADPAGRAVVHGDLHADNVLSGPEGPLLVDLELSGAGPAAYDTAAVVVAARRYGGDPVDADAFVRASGLDPREWPGFATCVAVYELWVTAWAVAHRLDGPDPAAEAGHRVAALGREPAPGDPVWRLR